MRKKSDRSYRHRAAYAGVDYDSRAERAEEVGESERMKPITLLGGSHIVRCHHS
jgi:hypothetical protein